MPVGPTPSRYALLIPKVFLQSFHHLDSESVCSIVRNVRIVACFCNGIASYTARCKGEDGLLYLAQRSWLIHTFIGQRATIQSHTLSEAARTAGEQGIEERKVRKFFLRIRCRAK